MTEVYINNERVDLVDGNVSQTFQLNDISNISTRQTSYTNKFKAKKTPRNIKNFKNLGMVGKTPQNQPKTFPYKTPDARIVEDGVALVYKGYAVLAQTNEKDYDLVIYGGEKNFFDRIKELTIKDVYPDTFLTYTAEGISNAIDRNDNYVFTVLQYNNYTRTFPNKDNAYPPTTMYDTTRMTPQFFIKDLFRFIFEFMGYTVDYPMVDDFIFNSLLTNASQSVVNFGVTYGQNFNLKNVAPTFKVTELIKEIMIDYCLMVAVDELNKVVKFTKFDDVLSSEPEDWSSKFHQFKKETYKIDNYARFNKFVTKGNDSEEDYDLESLRISQMAYVAEDGLSYQEMSPNVTIPIYKLPTDEFTGTFGIDNYTINDEKVFYTSIFKKPKLCYFDRNHISWSFNSLDTQYNAIWGILPVDKSSNYLGYSQEHHLIDLLEYEYEFNDTATEFNPNNVGDYRKGNIQYSKLNFIKSKKQTLEPHLFYKKTLNFQHVFGLTDANGNTVYFVKDSVSIAAYKKCYNNIPVSGNSEWIVRKSPISFQSFLNMNYQGFVKVLDKMQTLTLTMNLSLVDIYQLDFTKRKYIKQLGGYFYLNKVMNYKNGKLTECEFIRVPVNFYETSAYYYNATQMIGTL